MLKMDFQENLSMVKLDNTYKKVIVLVFVHEKPTNHLFHHENVFDAH